MKNMQFPKRPNLSLLFALTLFLAHSRIAHAEEKQKPDGESSGVFVELAWSAAEAEGVEIVPAGAAAIKKALSLNGEVSLNGDTIIHVSPRFPGVVKRVEKNLGDSVKAGTVLAVIQSNESLSTYEIRAEADGTIIEKDATRGEFVRDDTVLFVIADLSTVWVNAAVYPDDLPRVSPGRDVLIASRSVERATPGVISYLRPSLSEVTRTALVRVVLPNVAQRWLPGMFVRVDVLLDPMNVSVAVPASALQRIGNEDVVFVKANTPDGDEGFERRLVEVGTGDGEMIQIVNGIKPGEEVAAGKTFILKAELGKGSAAHED